MNSTATSRRELEQVEVMGRVAHEELKLTDAPAMPELSYRQGGACDGATSGCGPASGLWLPPLNDRGEEAIAGVDAGDGAEIGAAGQGHRVGPGENSSGFQALEFYLRIQ